MEIISKWKKRPKSYGLAFDEYMAEVIENGQTKHIKLRGSNDNQPK